MDFQSLFERSRSPSALHSVCLNCILNLRVLQARLHFARVMHLPCTSGAAAYMQSHTCRVNIQFSFHLYLHNRIPASLSHLMIFTLAYAAFGAAFCSEGMNGYFPTVSVKLA